MSGIEHRDQNDDHNVDTAVTALLSVRYVRRAVSSTPHPLRTTATGDFEFLPTRIYIWSFMQEIFNKIVQANNPEKYTIVFGSPGVGKSLPPSAVLVGLKWKKCCFFARHQQTMKAFLSFG